MRAVLCSIFSLLVAIFTVVACQSEVKTVRLEPIGKIVFDEKGDFVCSSRDHIEGNLRAKLNKYNRRWSPKTFDYTVDVLLVGEREYMVDHEIILNVMDIESNFNTKATRYNTNGTWDRGICQVNDCNIPEYERAATIMKKYNLWYTSTKNRYDLGLNIMSAYVYFDWSKRKLIQNNDFSEKRHIVSYNCGLSGSNENDPRYTYLKKKRQQYWERYNTNKL